MNNTPISKKRRSKMVFFGGALVMVEAQTKDHVLISVFVCFISFSIKFWVYYVYAATDRP
ncbi:Protein of unknown function [Pyronema omphalodes CBS 100304]|uniref:Uncharacterized protein n=1 Tax=Pyronema omphalodes (strain CBS 100304) TaxID=1076935 RepID=U4KUR3_PYROM|nr:Protein of unknown function [Pyronema omphalodes CBS 100304]